MIRAAVLMTLAITISAAHGCATPIEIPHGEDGGPPADRSPHQDAAISTPDAGEQQLDSASPPYRDGDGPASPGIEGGGPDASSPPDSAWVPDAAPTTDAGDAAAGDAAAGDAAAGDAAADDAAADDAAAGDAAADDAAADLLGG